MPPDGTDIGKPHPQRQAAQDHQCPAVMTRLSRRHFVGQAAAGGAALCGLSPAGIAAAKGQKPMQLQTFSDHEAQTYAAWCDLLAIGAAQAGVAEFADKYISSPYPECLLLIRYLQNRPFADFYRGGIEGIDTEARARFSKPLLDLTPGDRAAVVKAAATKSTIAWKDPDPNFFYFISRSDAVDVVYGTVAGFAELGIAYDPHISPSQPW